MEIRHKKCYPWLVVALLWGVALLNYMDRQMLSTMKGAIIMAKAGPLSTITIALSSLAGVFAGALITGWLGKSSDAGNLGRDMALLAIPVAVALILLLTTLNPEYSDKLED